MLGAAPQQHNSCAPRRTIAAVPLPGSIVATALTALPLAWLLSLSGAVSLPLAIAAMTVACFVIVSAGFLVLKAAGADDMPGAAAWAAGVFATAMGLYVLVVVFGLRSARAFALWAALVLVLALLARTRALRPRPLDAAQAATLVLCALATLFWCRELAEVPRILERDGVLATWTDQFIHGSVISQFGDPRAESRGAIELADVPAPFYHYATYLLPAAFASVLDLPGLTLATSMWVPLGFFTLCAGTYAFGAGLAGRAGGIAGLAVLTLLPDAASYGLHNRLFGYYWYVLAVPGASYAVGFALLSIALLQRWLQSREPRALAASFAMVLGLIVVRAHIFALLLPAWLACVALSCGALRNRKVLFCGAALLGLGALVWAFYSLFPDAPHALALFLDVTHNQQHPTAYRGLYAGLMAAFGPGIAVPTGIALVFAAMLGVFGPLYPAAVWLAKRTRGLQAIDAVPAAVLVCYLLLMITAPVPAHGDSTEFTQRPFVLAYAVVAVWTAGVFAGWIRSLGGLHEARVRMALAGLAALVVMWTLTYTVRDWRWAYSYRVADGLPEAAAFIRRNASPGDVLAAQGLSSSLVTTDLAVQLASLTGVPAYLTRPFMHISGGGRRGEAAAQRFSLLGAVERERSAGSALAKLHELGIRWYVVGQRDGRGPAWDPARGHAVFVDRMVAVYSTVPAAR